MLAKVEELEIKYRRALEDDEDKSRRAFVEAQQRKMNNAAELALCIEIMSSKSFYPLSTDSLFFQQMQRLQTELHQATCSAIHRIKDEKLKQKLLNEIKKNSLVDFYFVQNF